MSINLPWDQACYKDKRRANPEAATKKRAKAQHKKDKTFESKRKQVTPSLRAAERLLTKRTSRLLKEIAEGIAERTSWREGPRDPFVIPVTKHYVPLVENLKAEFAKAKQAAAVLRARTTKQKAYDQAKKDYLKAAWAATENMLRAGDLLNNLKDPGPYPQLSEPFFLAWEDLSELLRPAGVLQVANPSELEVLNRRAAGGDILARERFFKIWRGRP